MIDKKISKKRKDQLQYLKSLKEYKDLGVKIIIDGEDLPEEQWNRIFRVEENRSGRGSKSFYMADYIEEPSGNISEIRLDKIVVKSL